MKPSIRATIGIVFLLSALVCANESPYCTTGVSLTVSAPKQVFAPNEPIPVTVTLTNRAQTLESISIAPEEFPFAYRMDKLRPDGCWQILGERIKGGRLPDDSRWITLEHGKSHTQTVTVGISNFNAAYVNLKPVCDQKRSKHRRGASVYRAVFRHDGVRATDIRGNRPNAFGCVTQDAIFEFEISPRSRTQPPQQRASEQ
jgi:hypothetical protein